MRPLFKRLKYPYCDQAVIQYVPGVSGVEVVIAPLCQPIPPGTSDQCKTPPQIAWLYIRRRSNLALQGMDGPPARRWIVDWYWGPRGLPSEAEVAVQAASRRQTAGGAASGA